MKLSVIILNYNVRYFLELCLKSVAAATSNLEAEIIVVDNNSNDDSCEMVKRSFPNVVLIENKQNLGFSKANNQGVSIAKGEYVCILNPDTVVTEDTFVSLLSYAGGINNLGILSCKLIDGQGSFLPESKRNIPIPAVAIKKILGFSKSYYANHINQDEIGKVDVFVGAFMIIKRSVYNEIKGFDEAYFMYGEDIDLSYKILKAGYDNIYYGKTSIIHYKGESTLKDKIYAKRFYGAMQIFYDKHFKSNIVFDVVVWLGIQFAKMSSTEETKDTKLVKQNILVSDKSYPELEKKLGKNVQRTSKLPEILPNTQLILDVNYLSFKSIVDIIEASKNNSNISFKILPNNSNFIIGSNSSKSRGEVINF